MQAAEKGAEPVFVDRSGRRRRLFAVAGVAGAVGLALATLALVAGFTGAGASYLPTLPNPGRDQIREAVSTGHPATTSRAPRRAPRPSSPDSDAPATSRPAPAATSAPASAAPSPTRTNNRRVPTHTPGNKPSKPA